MSKNGRKPMASDRYSVSQVSALLLATAELWLRAAAGKTGLRFEGEQGYPDSGPGEIHADLLRRLFGGDWETVAIALADLDQAMARVHPRTLAGVAEFVSIGPQQISETDVEFQPDPVNDYGQSRPGQRAHVLTVWRSINRMGEFSLEPQVRVLRRTFSPTPEVVPVKSAPLCPCTRGLPCPEKEIASAS